jgi:RNA polymerase sigma-70 factor, ECF subfamily
MSVSPHSHALNPRASAPSAEISTMLGNPDLASLADTALVSRTRAGDLAAFAHLRGRHEPTLLGLARRYVRDEHDAQEIMQDVFMTTWRKLSGFEERAQISSWLYRVTVNAALMHLRARKRRPLVVPGAGAFEVANAYTAIPCDARLRPDEQLQSQELLGVIQQAVAALPASLRSVFEARGIQGCSTKQTGRMLGISQPAVKTRLHRARHILRQEIEQYQLQ